jgi:hypothetical protein
VLRKRRATLVALAACAAPVALVAAGAVSCLNATQITLHVSTNAICKDTSQWKGVSIYTGSPTDVETKAATLTTATCGADGQIGTLVLVPSGSDSDEIGVRVVAGLLRNPEDCASSLYDGCIVARRTLRYSPHKALDVYVALTDDCVGVSCDPTHTCVDGTCVDSSGPMSMPPPGSATVRCGDNGVRCTTSGQVCCLTTDVDAGTTHGVCEDPTSCPPTSIVLACDKESDCAGPRDDAGFPSVCCVSYVVGAGNAYQPESIAETECLPYQECIASTHSLEMCDDRKPCLDGKATCQASSTVPEGLFPGYFWCTLPP